MQISFVVVLLVVADAVAAAATVGSSEIRRSLSIGLNRKKMKKEFI